MNTALLVFLILLWAVFLLPGALRARRTSPTSSVGTFERAMDVLASREVFVRNREGRYVYVPGDAATIVGDRERRRQQVIARRRAWFVRLLVATIALAPFALFLGGVAWVAFLGGAAALAGYAVLLRRWKIQADQAAEVVRELPDIDEEVVVEQRMVAGGEDVAAIPPGYAPIEPEDPWQDHGTVRIRRWDG